MARRSAASGRRGFSSWRKLLATAEAGYLVTPHADVYWKAALMGQHYGRSADPGFPEAYKPYVTRSSLPTGSRR